MKKSKKIKDMSIYEASDFWDEHDFGEFDDIKEEKGIQFLFIKKKYNGIFLWFYLPVPDCSISCGFKNYK